MGKTSEQDHSEKVWLDDSDDSDPETECGIGKFRPAFLQGFANITAFVGTYSVVGMVTSTLSVYVSSQIPALEKQFGLNSAQIGLLMSCNDIGFFATVLFAASIARYVHIPRFISFCISLFGLSGVFCCLPHFIAVSRGVAPTWQLSTISEFDNKTNSIGTGEINTGILCNNGADTLNVTRSSCDGPQDEENTSVLAAPSISMQGTAVALIGIGMLLQGIGKSPRYPLFAVYIDDNGDRRKAGFYAGITSAASIFGPALSFGIGGVFSSYYVTLEDVDMSTRDPRWIGAWWLGFLVFGGISLFVTFFLMLFPRRMKVPGDAEAKGKHYVRTAKPTGTYKDKVKDSILAFPRVIKNPIYVVSLLSAMFNIISIAGYSSFLSKYIGSQFSVPLSTANYIIAGSVIVSVSMGAFFGGILTRKIAMTPRNSFKILVILSALSLTAFVSILFLGCDQPRILGPSRISGEENEISNFCSTDCHCDENRYFPVCGSNGVMYHSPCYAGCEELQRGGRDYSNCTCIPDGRATAGLCPTDCKTLIPFAVMNFVSSLISALKISPSFLVGIRCVADKDKSTAVGVNSFLMSVFGWGLSPIIFGRIVDRTCNIWQSPCDSSGACELYDNYKFRIWIHGFAFAFKFISLMIVSFGLWKVWDWTDWKSNEATQNKNAAIEVEKVLFKKKNNECDKSVLEGKE